MNLKKLSVTALSLTLSLGLLAGCSGKPAVSTGSPAPSPSATPSQSAPAESGGAVKTGLSLVTSVAKSKDASAEGDGLAQAYATVAAVTLNGDTVTSCFIDAVQANVKFDAAGKITTDLTAAQPSKNELGDAYGMKKASSIGKEWYEQAAAFSAYVTGKTVSEVSGIAVDDHESPTDADLAASVTIGIGEFQTLIEKAAV